MQTRAGAKRAPLACALGFALVGFGGLATFWAVGEWRGGLPGLFDYRSATIGDAVLLPTLVGCLVAGVQHLRVPQEEQASCPAPLPANERLWLAAAFAVGAILGAATQVAWRADPDPRLNWTLPEAHHFNSAGWYHAGFLTLSCGTLLALTVGFARRMRRAARSEAPSRRALAAEVAGSPWLAVGVAAGVLLVLMIALDNDVSSGTGAGTATTIGLVLASVISLGVVRWALAGLWRQAVSQPMALAAVSVIGATAIADRGLASPPEVGVVSVISAMLLALALTEPLLPDGYEGRVQAGDALIRPFHFVAIALLLLGLITVASAAVKERSAVAVLLVAVVPIVAVWLGQPPVRASGSRFQAWAAVVYGCGILVLGAWLYANPHDSTLAGLVLNVALGSIDFLAFTLLKRRFQELGTFERNVDRSTATSAKVTQKAGPYAWIQVVGFAAPALVGMFVVLSEAAPALGFDRHSVSGPTHLREVTFALLLALPTAAIAALITFFTRTRKGSEQWFTPLEVPVVATVMSVLAAGTWVGLLVAATPGELHYGVVAVLAGLVAATLCAEDIFRTGATLHFAWLGWRGGAVTASAAMINGISVFWLLSSGLWAGRHPVELGTALLAALASLGGAFVLTTALHGVVGFALRAPVLTAQHPTLNLLMAQIQYSLLILITGALPVGLVARVVEPGLPNPGLIAMAVVFSMLGIGVFVFWVMQNLWDYLAGELAADPPGALRTAVDGLGLGDRRGAQILRIVNNERLRLLVEHIYWQFAASLFLVLMATAWVVSEVV
jgi:hypothetical protein